MTIYEDALTAQIAAGLPGKTDGRDVRRGPPQKASNDQSLPRAIPEECVFVLETAGLDGVAFLGLTPSTVDPNQFCGFEEPGAQLFVRSKPHDFNGGEALAVKVRGLTNHHKPTGFFKQTAGPLFFIRKNEEDQYEWTINTLAMRAL